MACLDSAWFGNGMRGAATLIDFGEELEPVIRNAVDQFGKTRRVIAEGLSIWTEAAAAVRSTYIVIHLRLLGIHVSKLPSPLYGEDPP